MGRGVVTACRAWIVIRAGEAARCVACRDGRGVKPLAPQEVGVCVSMLGRKGNTIRDSVQVSCDEIAGGEVLRKPDRGQAREQASDDPRLSGGRRAIETAGRATSNHILLKQNLYGVLEVGTAGNVGL